MENPKIKSSPVDGLQSFTVAVADEQKSAGPQNRCVVRLRATIWSDKSGIYTKKSLTFLRRQCDGFNILDEDAKAIGAEHIIPRIINLDECRDGVYEVVPCNESHDFESGHIDDYDYKLIAAGPFP